MLNINIDAFRNTKKLDANKTRSRKKTESEYNNKFGIKMIEINANRRLLKFNDDDCD